ncbi:hypothetical protein Hanom_Chr11g01061361 [Helianthus anomalus]
MPTVCYNRCWCAKKMVVHLRQPSRLLWSNKAPARYPSTVMSEGFSQLCEASLTQCPLL